MGQQLNGQYRTGGACYLNKLASRNLIDNPHDLEKKEEAKRWERRMKKSLRKMKILKKECYIPSDGIKERERPEINITSSLQEQKKRISSLELENVSASACAAPRLV